MNTIPGGSLERAFTRAIGIALSLTLGLALAACADSGGGKKTGSADKPAEATVGDLLEGTVKGGESYYVTFPTDTPGEYEIALAGSGLSWTLYDDPDYTALSAPPRQATVTDCPGGSCTTDPLDGSTDYYLQIANPGEDEVDFTLTLETGMGQGSLSDPYPISADDLDVFAAQVGMAYSYYVFNLASVNSWCLSVSGSDTDPGGSLAENLNAYVYYEAGFGTPDLTGESGGGTPENLCTPGATYVDILYLKVDGTNTAAGMSFFLHVSSD